MAICSIPAFVCCILCAFLVESPFLLIRKKRFEKAAHSLRKMATMNGCAYEVDDVYDALVKTQLDLAMTVLVNTQMNTPARLM